ncbi:hypothetical protein B296_00040891 [Ensete ventricosum]|uniref:Uncharacterized protein n=1 Tax=Ensete ventricosum TaxID=4639 RepID=A0A426ZP48_ENSVE|nr:hypothetical protein B296_00040891 [Ensete ventricosum]
MQVVKVTSQKQIELEESLDILKETASQVGFQSKSSRAGSGTVDTFLKERQKIHFKYRHTMEMLCRFICSYTC